MEISVVILCYRSGQQIQKFVERTIGVLDRHMSLYEIILVGNYIENTNDDTPKIVKEIASKFANVRSVTLPKKGMMGWDARTGLDRATGRAICIIDGDEQMPPEDIIRVYEKLKLERLDLVKTYRIKRDDGVVRRFVSFAYNMIFKIFFPGLGVRDVNSKPKIFTRESYERMHLTSNDWFLDAEMMIRARAFKLKIGEIPTEFYKCTYRKSFVKFDAIVEFAKNMIRARMKEFSNKKHGG